jgi:hypothetical protein
VAPKVGDGDTEPKEDEATIPPAESPVATQTAAQKLAAANVAAANAEVPPDPFAREAKHFTEVRVLNRDVSKLDDTCKSCDHGYYISTTSLQGALSQYGWALTVDSSPSE